MNCKIGIPNRGRLYELCIDLIQQKFNCYIDKNSRRMRYSITLDDINIDFLFYRSSDIPFLLYNNAIDFGVTGNDYYIDSEQNIKELGNLYLLNGILCIIGGSRYNSLDTSDLVCFSQYPNIAKILTHNKKRSIKIQPINGAAESYLLENPTAITLDIVTSGQSNLSNDLSVICNLINISAHLYSSKDIYESNPSLCNLIKECFGVNKQMDVNSNAKLLAAIKRYEEGCNE